METRRSSTHQPLYAHLTRRVTEGGEPLPLNSEEALAYWITVLQRSAAESEFGTNSDPISEAPRLMAVKGQGGLVEVDLLKDDPQEALNETWSYFELWPLPEIGAA
jgi:hypothetical protein